tara:strand:+ start:3078 stop:3458 length:381 start_codon:yes stop_codon:yes gene_type:complete
MKRFIIKSYQIKWRCIEAIEEITLDGKEQEVIIREHKNSRSVEQNNLFHAIIRAIADSTGHSVEEIKEYVCQEYLGTVEYTGLDGSERSRVKSTSELDVEGMSGLIERVKQLGDQLNIRMEHIEHG